MNSDDKIQSVCTKVSACLSCGTPCDAATQFDKPGAVKPKPGDVTICLYCGHIMAFADNLGLRELTGAEMQDVAGDPRVLQLQRARAKTMQKRR